MWNLKRETEWWSGVGEMEETGSAGEMEQAVSYKIHEF